MLRCDVFHINILINIRVKRPSREKKTWHPIFFGGSFGAKPFSEGWAPALRAKSWNRRSDTWGWVVRSYEQGRTNQRIYSRACYFKNQNTRHTGTIAPRRHRLPHLQMDSFPHTRGTFSICSQPPLRGPSPPSQSRWRAPTPQRPPRTTPPRPNRPQPPPPSSSLIC